MEVYGLWMENKATLKHRFSSAWGQHCGVQPAIYDSIDICKYKINPVHFAGEKTTHINKLFMCNGCVKTNNSWIIYNAHLK